MADSKLELRLKSKNKGGRPKVSRTCQPDVPLKPSKKMAALMAGCYTDDEWQRRFKLLPISEQFRLRGGAEPKPKEEPTGNTFTLIVSGLSRPCSKCGHKPEPAPCVKCGHLETQPAPPGSTESSTAGPNTASRDAHLPPPKGLPGDFFQEDPEKPKKPVRYSIDPGEVDLG